MSQLLPRFTQAAHRTADPIDIAIADMQRREAEAREAINRGHTPQADPADLRGIPCIARGVGGTSPGTAPHTHNFTIT